MSFSGFDGETKMRDMSCGLPGLYLVTFGKWNIHIFVWIYLAVVFVRPKPWLKSWKCPSIRTLSLAYLTTCLHFTIFSFPSGTQRFVFQPPPSYPRRQCGPTCLCVGTWVLVKSFSTQFAGQTNAFCSWCLVGINGLDTLKICVLKGCENILKQHNIKNKCIIWILLLSWSCVHLHFYIYNIVRMITLPLVL